MSIATRFVPLAITGGKPKNISNGIVRKEPPPAFTLIKPAMLPQGIHKEI